MEDVMFLIWTLILVLAGPAAPAAIAAEPTDPDWPCIQRLVPEIAASQMWSGPSLEIAEDEPPDDAGRAALANRLASRTTPMAEAEEEIAEFADGLAPEARDTQIAGLLRDVLELINAERSEIIAGIKRYTRKQRRLADKITRNNQQLRDLQPGTMPAAESEALLEERNWDVRVFEDRQRVLRQICEQPVLMEQRAFALARALQTQLESN